MCKSRHLRLCISVISHVHFYGSTFLCVSIYDTSVSLGTYMTISLLQSNPFLGPNFPQGGVPGDVNDG